MNRARFDGDVPVCISITGHAATLNEVKAPS
jgi:hypothetical protein